ncbi:hypothetical protein ACRE_033690 [Hapsidospora chrysogenum ATCC 11550]|uniref:Uncharacterized protein n=1 Tax=Hapsidospora chrysogenum (strain ATCC 11550 / CBS 779.69 / DSM 880 / IAM 14645 / JCM 23072 / IMI 49137) TaxID=857340 RepID=A0A086T8U2_HAPC1|nr:hypothetical protein ACRE_033690 [Hapsidospora chrysogenum ATCC 11550]
MRCGAGVMHERKGGEEDGGEGGVHSSRRCQAKGPAAYHCNAPRRRPSLSTSLALCVPAICEANRTGGAVLGEASKKNQRNDVTDKDGKWVHVQSSEATGRTL